MRHRMTIVAVFLFLFVARTIASGAGNDVMNRCHLDWHRNNAWPQPFTLIDRVAACSPFAAMTMKGWQRQSTITNYHFDHATQQLTEPGELKVIEILRTNPTNHRAVVMVRGITDEETARRQASINNVAMRMSRDGRPTQIIGVDIEPRTWPAEDIEMIGVQWRNTFPQPRLSAMESTINGEL